MTETVDNVQETQMDLVQLFHRQVFLRKICHRLVLADCKMQKVTTALKVLTWVQIKFIHNTYDTCKLQLGHHAPHQQTHLPPVDQERTPTAASQEALRLVAVLSSWHVQWF